MGFQFWKMHACGNDFAIVDTRKIPVDFSPKFIQHLASRHFGIGFDSLLILSKPQDTSHAAFYRVFNADGSEAGQCGNGARCIAQLLYLESNQKQIHFSLETLEQVITLDVIRENLIRADLAIPSFKANDIPIKLSAQSINDMPFYEFELPQNQQIEFYGVWLGNPHAVILAPDLETAPVKLIGDALNHNPAFPAGINVSFVQIENEHSIKIRVFERGVGETMACGSGACASALVALKLGKVANPVQVFFMSPENSSREKFAVEVQWTDEKQPVSLTGSAELVYKGTWLED